MQKSNLQKIKSKIFSSLYNEKCRLWLGEFNNITRTGLRQGVKYFLHNNTPMLAIDCYRSKGINVT